MTKKIKNIKVKATIKVLDLITEHMEKDIVELSKKPFNGDTVATMFGGQAAAIATLANIIKAHLEEQKKGGN